MDRTRAVTSWERAALLIGGLVVIFSTPVLAQETGESSDGMTSRPWLDRAIVAARLQGGRYGYDAVPALPGLEGGNVWKLGMSFFPGPPFPSWLVGFDFHAWGLKRSYTTVLEGAAENETELSTDGFGLGARIGVPMASPIGVYVLGGFTYVDHVMKVEMQPAWFFPNLGNSREEEGGGWGRYWGLAADIRVGDFAFGVEQRWVRSQATFDEPFSMTDLPLGGSTLFIGLTLYGGRTRGGVRAP